MKAIILKDRFNVYAVFVRNEVSENEVQQLQSVAEPYMQEVVVKDVVTSRTIGDIVDEIRALNDDTGGDDA